MKDSRVNRPPAEKITLHTPFVTKGWMEENCITSYVLDELKTSKKEGCIKFYFLASIFIYMWYFADAFIYLFYSFILLVTN